MISMQWLHFSRDFALFRSMNIGTVCWNTQTKLWEIQLSKLPYLYVWKRNEWCWWSITVFFCTHINVQTEFGSIFFGYWIDRRMKLQFRKHYNFVYAMSVCDRSCVYICTIALLCTMFRVSEPHINVALYMMIILYTNITDLYSEFRT